MEITSKSHNLKDATVEELMQIARFRRITIPRFKLPMTPSQAFSWLIAFYRVEVELRQRNFVDDEQTNTKAMEIADYLTGNSPQFGMLLCGGCGTGKTTFIYALQNMINRMKDKHLFDEEIQRYASIKLVTAREIAFMATNDFPKFKSLCFLESVVAIDDLGEEAKEVLNYGNVQNPIIELLEIRYAHQLTTFITSNLSPEQISEKYKARVADRLFEMVKSVVFDNPQSYRRMEDDHDIQNYKKVC